MKKEKAAQAAAERDASRRADTWGCAAAPPEPSPLPEKRTNPRCLQLDSWAWLEHWFQHAKESADSTQTLISNHVFLHNKQTLVLCTICKPWDSAQYTKHGFLQICKPKGGGRVKEHYHFQRLKHSKVEITNRLKEWDLWEMKKNKSSQLVTQIRNFQYQNVNWL